MRKVLVVAVALGAVSTFAETFVCGDWTVKGGKGPVSLAYRGKTLISRVSFGYWNANYRGMRLGEGADSAVRDGETVTFVRANDHASLKLAVTMSGKRARLVLDADFLKAPGPFEYGFYLPLANFSGEKGVPFMRLGRDFFVVEPDVKFEARGGRDMTFEMPEATYRFSNLGKGAFALQDTRASDRGNVRDVTWTSIEAPTKLHYEHEWTVTDGFDEAVVAARKASFGRPLVSVEPVEVANPGFEDGKAGWDFSRNMAVDESVARSGKKSACVTVRDPKREAVYLTRQIPIRAGAKYRASCFVKTEDVREAEGAHSSVGAGLIVEWCDKNGKWMQGGDYATGLFGTNDWRQVKCTRLIAPEAAGYAQVYLTLRGTGKAWFDDLQFDRIDTSMDKLEPLNGSRFANNCPHFAWRQASGVRRHAVELSRDPAFAAGQVRRYDAGGFTEFQLEEPLEPGTWYWRVVASGIDDSHPWRFEQTALKTQDCLAPIPADRAKRVTRNDEAFTVTVKASAAERPTVRIGDWTGTVAGGTDGALTVRFDPPSGGWPKGFLETKIVTGDAAGNRAERPFWFLHAPVPANPAVIGKDGMFAENGRRIFPLGIYEVAPKYLKEVRAAGFDAVHMYRWENEQDDVACRRYLDQCWAADGLRAFIGFDRGNSTGEGIVQGNFAHIARRVGALADHPGLFCWYLFDEPEILGQFVTPDMLTAFADLVRALDPYHAVVMTTWGPTMNEYRRTWDTHWTQAYEAPAGVMNTLADHRRLLKNASPITLLVNCNDGKQGTARRRGIKPDPEKFCRDYDHLRACAFIGVVKACNGLWWWWFARDCTDYYTAAQSPKAWADLTRVVREIVALRPLVNADGKVSMGTAAKGKDKVEWWLKTVDGKTTFIAVNTADKPLEVEIDLPGIGKRAYSFARYEVKRVEDPR